MPLMAVQHTLDGPKHALDGLHHGLLAYSMAGLLWHRLFSKYTTDACAAACAGLGGGGRAASLPLVYHWYIDE